VHIFFKHWTVSYLQKNPPTHNEERKKERKKESYEESYPIFSLFRLVAFYFRWWFIRARWMLLIYCDYKLSTSSYDIFHSIATAFLKYKNSLRISTHAWTNDREYMQFPTKPHCVTLKISDNTLWIHRNEVRWITISLFALAVCTDNVQSMTSHVILYFTNLQVTLLFYITFFACHTF